MARVSDAFMERLRKAAEAPDEPDRPTREDYIPWWSPEDGDRLAGELIRIDIVETEWGPRSLLVVDDSKHGRIRYTAPSVLERLIQREKPQPGEVIGIVYAGKKHSKRNEGHQYHDFRFIVDRPSGQMTLPEDWQDVDKVIGPVTGATPDPFEDQ